MMATRTKAKEKLAAAKQARDAAKKTMLAAELALNKLLPAPGSPDSNPLDLQVGGDHYKKFLVQQLEFAMLNGLDACQFSIVKYVTRFRDKGTKEEGVKDLQKARHVLDILIELETNGPRSLVERLTLRAEEFVLEE